MKYLVTGLLLLAMGFIIPPRTISGKIMDETGRSLGYAGIAVKGTAKTTHTDKDGKFSLLVNDGDVLVISFIGYETKEIKVAGNTVWQIRLQPAVALLDETVITGYNAQSTALAANRQLKMAMISTPGFVAGGAYRSSPGYNREGYDPITENGYKKVLDHPLSTFSIDVDAASYSNVRRILKSGQLPDPGAVRVEEMINYFHYQYDQPGNNDPFAVHMEVGACPWNPQHQLALIGLQARKIDMGKLPASNLTFLIDVSGSMMSIDKLPLVKESLKLLVDQLREEDRVSLVVYAGSAGLVLEPTSGSDKMKIKEAVSRLEAGGSTAGGAGIQLAYKTARQYFMAQGNNRVILCTDGDFNVGASSDDALERMIEQERKSGVFLTVLGFGTGNYQDAKMQKLADKGNGNHAYIDQLGEAKKVFISEFGGTLHTIAKDVKLQVEFNPANVKGYRLVGYENRMLNKEDFNDDKKDAGELGSGHTVTALYEIVPAGAEMPETGMADSLRYQTQLTGVSTEQRKLGDEILNVKVRYKAPDGDKSSLRSYPLVWKGSHARPLSANFRFAAAVASFGMLLRNSEYKGTSSYQSVLSLAERSLGDDEEGYRKEFLQLVNKAAYLKGNAGNNE